MPLYSRQKNPTLAFKILSNTNLFKKHLSWPFVTHIPSPMLSCPSLVLALIFSHHKTSLLISVWLLLFNPLLPHSVVSQLWSGLYGTELSFFLSLSCSSLHGLGSTGLTNTMKVAVYDNFVYLCGLRSPVSWKSHPYWTAPHNLCQVPFTCCACGAWGGGWCAAHLTFM